MVYIIRTSFLTHQSTFFTLRLNSYQKKNRFTTANLSQKNSTMEQDVDRSQYLRWPPRFFHDGGKLIIKSSKSIFRPQKRKGQLPIYQTYKRWKKMKKRKNNILMAEMQHRNEKMMIDGYLKHWYDLRLIYKPKEHIYKEAVHILRPIDICLGIIKLDDIEQLDESKQNHQRHKRQIPNKNGNGYMIAETSSKVKNSVRRCTRNKNYLWEKIMAENNNFYKKTRMSCMVFRWSFIFQVDIQKK